MVTGVVREGKSKGLEVTGGGVLLDDMVVGENLVAEYDLREVAGEVEDLTVGEVEVAKLGENLVSVGDGDENFLSARSLLGEMLLLLLLLL